MSTAPSLLVDLDAFERQALWFILMHVRAADVSITGWTPQQTRLMDRLIGELGNQGGT